ncbi:hypothetical protein IGI86_001846 [Enterococcus sp. AZ188]|uniref:hypothetical protein n=1 Tax=Enterococcus sp. AZ188 TaxID=2774678 RepID=UPI003D2FE91E
MKISQIETQKKNYLDLEELYALSAAYGNGMQRKEVVRLIAMPALVIGIMLGFLTYLWWVVLIGMAFGGWYGYRKILPKIVQRRYETEALAARNHFMNTMTQVMADPSKTVIRSIEHILPRMRGELQTDMSELVASLAIGADMQLVIDTMTKLNEKYHEDVLFCQYLEQLETTIHEGKHNVSSMQDLTQHHNDMLQKRKLIFAAKDDYLRGVKLMSTMIIGLIGMFHLSSYVMGNSFEMYIDGFARSMVGYITTGIYVPIYFLIINRFLKNYFDDSVMEVAVRTK